MTTTNSNNQTITEPPEQEPTTYTEKELKKQIKAKDEEITRLNKRIKHIKREFENILNQIPYNEENRIARQLMYRQIELI